MYVHECSRRFPHRRFGFTADGQHGSVTIAEWWAGLDPADQQLIRENLHAHPISREVRGLLLRSGLRPKDASWHTGPDVTYLMVIPLTVRRYVESLPG
jgi:hypothetical protein